jgi:hypothetical protein
MVKSVTKRKGRAGSYTESRRLSTRGWHAGGETKLLIFERWFATKYLKKKM